MQNGSVSTVTMQNGVHSIVQNGTCSGDSIHFTTKSKMSDQLVDPVMKADVDSVKGKPALLIWRNNKGEMERVPEKEYGKFYTGDCYVVYQCLKKKNAKRPVLHIHFWIGRDSNEQDERMDVALHTIQLDDYLGGCAVQYREVMGQESAEFTAIFNGRTAPNLRYAKGGYETRLKKVTAAVNVTQLYEIKGRRHAQATEVDCKLASLNSDDCYVLDGGKSLFVLWGKKSNKHEKSKAYKLACSIRDNEQGGRGQIHIIEEENLNNNEFVKEIRKLFGLLPSNQLRFENLKGLQAASDEEADKKQVANSKLYKISDAGGSVEIKELGSPRQCLLDTNDCFILFTGLNVYVWKGRRANPNEKRAAIRTAKEFLKNLQVDQNMGIALMPEYSETAAFRSCFPSWKDDSEASLPVDYSKPAIPGNVAKSVHTVIDFRTLHQKPQKKIVIDDPYADDDGKSKALKIYQVNLKASQKRMECARDGFVFNSGDCYVLVYQYGPGNKNCIIYYWIGNECRQLEKGTAAKIAIDIDEREFNDEAIQERVFEGKEPPHFMRIFDGYVLVKQDRLERNDEHLFHVKAKREHDCRVVEVEVDASNLNSNDCFILDCKKGIYLWYGKGSTGDEQRVAREASAAMYPKRGSPGNYIVVGEGAEKDDFWYGIGGRKSYATQLMNISDEEYTEHEPRLYHCYNIRGSLEVEEVFDFDQDDLNPNDVFFLDTYYRLYVWVGKGARRDEKEQSIEFVQEFVKNDPTPRTGLDENISLIGQGAEPECFKAYFGVWEDERVEIMSPEEHKRLAMEHNAVALERDDAPKQLYSLAELQGVPAEDLPYGVDVETRELHLQDDDFQETFKMSKEEYNKLPKWKRENLRKEHRLF